MTEQELAQLEAQHDLAERLAHPDPDPSDLPAIIPPELLQQEQTALHILRSSLTLDKWISEQKKRMEQDMADWALNIATLEAKRTAWREMVKAWMQRNDVTQLRCPWFTASITKARVKKVVVDEAAAIEECKKSYPKAVKVIEKLDKKEFDVACDTFPTVFKDLFTEEVGEPGLMIRRTKE